MERWREMLRFIFPGRTDPGARPHSWLLIHMRSSSDWPEVAAQLERLIGKLRLCADCLHQASVVQGNSAFKKK